MHFYLYACSVKLITVAVAEDDYQQQEEEQQTGIDSTFTAATEKSTIISHNIHLLLSYFFDFNSYSVVV